MENNNQNQPQKPNLTIVENTSGLTSSDSVQPIQPLGTQSNEQLDNVRSIDQNDPDSVPVPQLGELKDAKRRHPSAFHSSQ